MHMNDADNPKPEQSIDIQDISAQNHGQVNVAGGNVQQTTIHIEQAHLDKSTLEELLHPAPHELPYHNLPRPDYARFVGREAELAWLRNRLSPEDRAWQIAITGIGGVGKSALALAIAHEYREKYKTLLPEERFDAIIWISAKEEVLTAQGKEQADQPENVLRTLEDVYTAIARSLEREDITRALPKEQDSVVKKALRAQRTLLVMDNLESVKDERIKPFLRNLPAPTKALITSREWLDVADVWQLKGLSAVEADQLISEESSLRQVLLDTVQRQRIYDLTSGLPLPIKLAVARIAGGETFSAVERWLGDAKGDLPEYCIAGQAELARWRDPNVWKLLLACSLFDRAAGASRDALGYVADLSLADRDTGLTHLQHLFLINRTEADRFWLLPIMQRYCAYKLPEQRDKSFINRWVEWVLSFLNENKFNTNAKPDQIEKLRKEYPNILSVIRWCRERGLWDELTSLALGAYFYPRIVGLMSDYHEILSNGLEASRHIPDKLKMAVLHRHMGVYYWMQKQFDDAKTHLEDAERIADELGNKNLLIKCWYIDASILTENDNLDQAEILLLKSLALAEELGHLIEKTSILERLARIQLIKENPEESLRYITLEEILARENGLSQSLAYCLNVRAQIMLKIRNFDAAERALTESLELSMARGDIRLIAVNKHWLATLYAVTERTLLATQAAKEACDLFDKVGLLAEKDETANLLKRLQDSPI